MAVPTVNVTLYTTVSLGGYGEALLIGNLLLLVALAGHAHPDRWPLFALWAILAGIGFWAFGLTLVYIVPTGALLMWLAAHRPDWRRRLGTTGVMVAGFVVGASPWIAWAAVHGLTSLFQELAGSAIAGASSASLAQTLGARSLNLALFGSTVALGLRPPWVVRWLGIPLMPLVLAFWVAVAVWAAGALGKRDGRRLGGWLLAGVVVLLAAGFVLTPFGADPSGRYFVPLAVPMAIAGGGAIEDWRSRLHTPWIYAVAAVVLLFNLWGTLEGAKANPPGITTQFDAVTQVDHRYDAALMTFLDTVGESRGYTNYWVAYPLAFLSGEQLTFVPRLPYHLDFRYTPRDDRYPPYDVAVAEAERVAYVVTLHPALETRLRAAFTSLGVRWKERRIGDYEVFFELSRKVTPEEIGL
jgi:hypothetical protein